MPLYEFTCRDCNETFQEKRPFARAGDPAACPICASANTRKQLGAVALHTGSQPASIPVSMSNGGGCCGGGSCGCHR